MSRRIWPRAAKPFVIGVGKHFSLAAFVFISAIAMRTKKNPQNEAFCEIKASGNSSAVTNMS